MLSVNQMNAQIKMTEMWKSNNVPNYPLNIVRKTQEKEIRTTRAETSDQLIEPGKTCILQNTSLSDASRAWNKVPNCIRQCETIWSAKKEIKKFVKQLPI